MNITETPCDEKLKITKCVRFDCDDADESIPFPLPRVLNFAWALIGGAGSGKSTLLANLFCKEGRSPYWKKFDTVHVWSPSLASMSKQVFTIPEEQIFNALDVDEIEGVVESLDPTERNLLVFDDVVAEMREATMTTLLARLLFNRRHLGLAIIMTSQVWNRIPLVLRRTFTQISLFKTARKEVDNIVEEHIQIDKKDFEKVLRFSYRAKNDFLHIDTTMPPHDCFFRNFNKLTLKDPRDEELIDPE
tara:strand:+ start:166 stop:906 length:741 start_codon:yes stop_codon:yes gene_type:complete